MNATVYRAAIAHIVSLKVAPAAAALHVRTGFTDGQVCLDCDHLAELWRTGAEPIPYCSASGGVTRWSGDWPACGRFYAKTASRPRPADDEQLPFADRYEEGE